MEIEMASCECCGLEEECTQDYIVEVKSKFEGKWLCGLCSEAVRDELNRVVMGKMMMKNAAAVAAAAAHHQFGLQDAVRAHMSFCGKHSKSNPAFRVADGMRQMLRRRSTAASPPTSLPASPSSSSSKKLLSRSASTVSFY